jgi:UDP-N-acetylglucosamine acyltransferase
MIHPTAIVHPRAQIDSSVEVGPYAVIDEHVQLGAGCKVGPHAYITGHTVVGANNAFHVAAVIGEAPQDLKYKNDPTCLRIGDDNIFREQVTVHRSNKMEADTVVGSNNFFMANSHVGHNCVIGNHVIIVNGALLAGHVEVQDRAFISGNCLLHQFSRVGALALMQGGSAISKDLPPFTIATGHNTICGLNMVGMRRAGFDSALRLELKRLYHFLFRSGHNLRTAVAEAQQQFSGKAAVQMIAFIADSKRGVCVPDGARTASEEVAEND